MLNYKIWKTRRLRKIKGRCSRLGARGHGFEGVKVEARVRETGKKDGRVGSENEDGLICA